MKAPILVIKLKGVNFAWRQHKQIPLQGVLHNRYAGKRFSLHANPAFRPLLKQAAREDGVTVERLLDVVLFCSSPRGTGFRVKTFLIWTRLPKIKTTFQSLPGDTTPM